MGHTEKADLRLFSFLGTRWSLLLLGLHHHHHPQAVLLGSFL